MAGSSEDFISIYLIQQLWLLHSEEEKGIVTAGKRLSDILEN